MRRRRSASRKAQPQPRAYLVGFTSSLPLGCVVVALLLCVAAAYGLHVPTLTLTAGREQRGELLELKDAPTATGVHVPAIHSAIAALPAVADKLRKRYEVLKVYDHDPKAFTQGLSWYEGQLYESTGMHRRSQVRRVDLETGAVLDSASIPDHFFGEGMTILNDTIHQLTWQGKQGFMYNSTTLDPLGTFKYATSNGQGWGITHNDTHLIVSDGSSLLLFWDPVSHTEIGRLEVTRDGAPVERINELEYFNGCVWANVWFSDEILCIDPTTGVVLDAIDFADIYPAELRKKELKDMDAVLNGIAYDDVEKVLYITGKLWPRLYKVKLLDKVL